MRSRSLRNRSPLLWFVLPFAFGVVAGRLGLALPPLLLLAFSLLLVGLAWRGLAWRPWAWPLCFALALLLAGAASYQIHRRRVAEREALPSREVELSLRCDRVFSGGKQGQCSLIGVIERADAHLRELEGQRVYASLKLTKGQAPPLRSEGLRVRGVLSPLVIAPEKRDFASFLSEGGVGFRLTRCSTWRVERVAGPYARLREAGLQTFSRVLDEGLLKRRPELAGILKAMMLGRQSELSAEQKERYMLSGTMHLFAISGLHIAVIAAALGGLVGWLPLGAWGRFLLTTSLLWFYVDVTGAAPSALRSYLMVVCVQLSWLGRLPGSSLSGLCLATTWVLVLSPLDFFSAGFQMSYGIVAALILYGQPLTEFLLERFDPFAPVPQILRGPGQRCLELLRVWALPTAALSISAGLISLLSGIAFFGTLSHGSVLANLLMIPASVLVIHAGFVALVLGLAGWAGAAALFNYAAGLVLWAMDAVLAWFVGLPGVYAPLVFRQAWLGGAGLGVFLLLMLACYALRWGRRGGLLWLPPLAATAFVALAAVFPS